MSTETDIPRELYYLDESFSVRSLRKYQLKEILAAHGIPYLHTIARPDLINLFKRHVLLRREEILREYREKESVKKQAEVKEELGRGRRTIQKPHYDDMVELPKRRTRTVKKDKDGFAVPSVPKRRQPAASTFNPEDSFGEEDEYTHKDDEIPVAEPVQRRKTKTKLVSVKQEIDVPSITPHVSNKPAKKVKFGSSSFNPEDSFASSDDDEEYSVMEGKRQVPQKAVKIESTSTFVRENEDEDEEYHADTDEDDEDDEDIGMIDKEELVQLYKDQAVPPEELIKPAYSVLTRSQTTAAANNFRVLWQTRITRIGYILCSVYMMVALIGLSITAYARQKNGYCQSHPAVMSNASRSVSNSFFAQLPSPCIPCPDHGICVDGELTCDTLYERRTPLYNIGHMLPIADDCIHNSVLGKYVARVERKIKSKLALRQGEAACNHLLAHADADQTEPAPIVRVSVKDILADLKESIQPPLPADKEDEIMIIALASILEDPKIHYWEVDGNRYLGTELVEYSLGCQIKRLYKKTPFRAKMIILSLFSIITAVVGASRDYQKNKAYKEKISKLVKATTEQLKEQYDNHIKDPKQYTTPALPVSQIRSGIVDLNDSKTLNDWQKVVERVEAHPHIRKSFQEVRGDPVEYWELTA